MPTTLLTNANLVCLEEAGSWGQIQSGAVVIEDETIKWKGPASEIPSQYRQSQVTVFDCDNKLLTPGLIDCHTHLVYAGNRAGEFEQRLSGVSYSDIAKAGGGIMNTVRATRMASEEELVATSLPRMQAMLSEGITTIEIKSGYGLEKNAETTMLRAARTLASQCNVSAHLTFLAAHALPEEFSGQADRYIDLVCEEMLPAAVESGIVDAVDAFCENIGFSLRQVEKVFDAADRYGLPIKCHAEQLSNTGSAAMCAERGALSVDHLEYLGKEDVQVMRGSDTVAVLLPGAFYVLRETQLPPIQLLRDAGISMALATDANPGSSPIFSPLTVMNMGCTLFAMTPLETLSGFTIEAAKALGIAEHKGSISVGKQADLVLWNYQHPAELSYHIGMNPCERVMQGGQWRTQNKLPQVANG